MSDPVTETIGLAQAQERLRQERETFDHRKRQDSRWFLLRLAMGWVSVGLLPLIALASVWIIVRHQNFAVSTVTLATSALLVDTLGLVLAVWRIVIGRGPAVFGPVVGEEDET